MILILENNPSKKLHIRHLKENQQIIIPSEINASEKEFKVIKLYYQRFNWLNFDSNLNDKQSRLLGVNIKKFNFFDINDINILVKFLKIAELADLHEIKKIVSAKIAFLLVKNEI